MTERQFQLSDDSAEAYRLEAALGDPAGGPKPPDGFKARCIAAIRNARARAVEPSLRRFPRSLKIAASIAVVAAFTGLAAWFAVESLSVPEEPAVAEIRVDEETEAITKESGVNMIGRKTAGIVGAALTTLAVGATELESEPTFVFLRPETSSFWHTATNNTMTVPVDFPASATSARLYVSGVAYNRTYDNVAEGEFTFELPPAESDDTENVYDLALQFDDDANTVRTAKLGLIKGLSPDAEGTTRCLAPASGNLWGKASKKAVLPIPYGTTSLSVNGVETPTGLDGAQGWYALRIKPGELYSLSLIANEVTYAASILGGGAGMMIIMR